jgi:hypothetical protein
MNEYTPNQPQPVPYQGFKSQEPALAVAPQQTEETPQTYPMEIFVNGELSFKIDTEDAEGDLAVIKMVMNWRAAKRQNRPLTNNELYGTDLGLSDVRWRSHVSTASKLTQ